MLEVTDENLAEWEKTARADAAHPVTGELKEPWVVLALAAEARRSRFPLN